ncbi:MAG: SGNH/GDSL hydrolase family protein [Planctomycetota bacterium]
MSTASEAPARLPLRKKILFTLLVCLVGLAILEAAVRLVVGNPRPERLPLALVRAHKTRGWEMVPHTEHYTYEHLVRVNNLGLRGEDVLEKAPGEVRVLVVGDSMVYGQGVPEEGTIPSRLERALAGSVRAVNGGLRAYSTNQELAMLEELGPRIRPDVVVLCWFWNDVEAVSVERAYRRLAGRGEIPFDTRTELEGASMTRWRMRQLLRKSALLMLAHDLVATVRAEWPNREVLDAGLAELDGHLAEFKRWTGTRKIPLVFAVVPNPNSIPEGHPSEELERRAAEVARRHGLPVVNLLAALRELERREGAIVIPYDGHYAASANGVIAREIAREVEPRLPTVD